MNSNTANLPIHITIKAVLLTALIFCLTSKSAHAGSATWDLDPTTADWNTAVNWTPDTVPNGASQTATFAMSNTTEVALSAFTTVNGIVFSPGASAFTLSTYLQTLEIEGAGITNNSGITQQFLVPIDPSGTHGVLEFFNTATAGSNTGYVIEGSEAAADGGLINFWGSSTARRCLICPEGGRQQCAHDRRPYLFQ